MTQHIPAVFALVLSAMPAVFAASNATTVTPPCLDALHGTWRGRGTLLGRSIVMEQTWAPALGGAFTELRMRHLATDTSTRASFEGRGLYRIVGARAPDSLHGTWLDSRGIIFEVRGACDGASFSSTWSGSERGRTIYQLRGEELEVIDSVFTPAGIGREFGRSRLRR